MPTNRVASATVTGAAVPTSADTALVSIAPGPLNPPNLPVLVQAHMALIGASSVTIVTAKIHRGQTAAGAALYSQAYTVTGTVIVGAVLAFRDTAYDGTGYTVSAQATGAAATADVTLEAQPLNATF